MKEFLIQSIVIPFMLKPDHCALLSSRGKYLLPLSQVFHLEVSLKIPQVCQQLCEKNFDIQRTIESIILVDISSIDV